MAKSSEYFVFNFLKGIFMMFRSFPFSISCDGSGVGRYKYEGEIQCLSIYVDDRFSDSESVSIYVSHLPIPTIVYTDDGFIETLKAILAFDYGMSIPVLETLEYSEQGMQDYDCVHLFADAPFGNEFFEKVYKQ